MNIVKNSYKDGVCPDCNENIPEDMDTEGDACSNCGHVFYVSTEEVCDKCGSSNIGYDAWVKLRGHKFEVVGGPYDNSQCLNEHCEEVNPNVRHVASNTLKHCDGKDCYYHGDQDVMKEIYASNPIYAGQNYKDADEAYWYCSRCSTSNNYEEEKLVAHGEIN